VTAFKNNEQAALEMARGILGMAPAGRRPSLAAALQKLMDERDHLARLYDSTSHAWRQRAEAAEAKFAELVCETRGYAELLPRPFNEHLAAILAKHEAKS
jgi:hypothetical protein